MAKGTKYLSLFENRSESKTIEGCTDDRPRGTERNNKCQKKKNYVCIEINEDS